MGLGLVRRDRLAQSTDAVEQVLQLRREGLQHDLDLLAVRVGVGAKVLGLGLGLEFVRSSLISTWLGSGLGLGLRFGVRVRVGVTVRVGVKVRVGVR